jgi:hydrogenase expression/formation protein HypE
MHQRPHSPRIEQTSGLPGFRNALHAGYSPGSDHGFRGGRLCCVLSLSPMNGERAIPMNPACSTPFPASDRVLLAHGGGGRLMHELIEKVFLPSFGSPLLSPRHDAAVFAVGQQRIAFTTDSYVVRPLFFPGGDIGSLAVNGTVNDLAMAGARPLYLSVAFIIEEGLSMETLRRVVESMRKAADACGVQLVTGDTKVVDRGKGDELFINTSGIGIIEHPFPITPASVREGDVVLLSGDIGRHGMAVMSVREGLEFETVIESDCAPLAESVSILLSAGAEVHCLRDLTRGGLASALNEIAQFCALQIDVVESAIPVRADVEGACEILGLDPLYVANEGRFIAIVPERGRDAALAALRSHPLGRDASAIGVVVRGRGGMVTLTNRIGAPRILDLLSGEQLPRIC